MKYKQRLKRCFVCFICLFLIAINCSGAFCAQSAFDTNKAVSLTLINQCGGTAFHMYKVASIGPDITFTRTAAFLDYDVSLNQTSQEGWRNAALALSGYVNRDQIAPAASGTVGGDGSVSFADLEQGLYLVVGETGVKDGYTYIPQPFLICLPDESADGDWEYDVTAKPKCDIIPPESPPADTKLTRKVMKVWNDENQAERPASVTVQLLRNGQVWAEVVLRMENDWRHTWDSLDSQYLWQVVEKQVPDGYSVGIEQEGTIFIVTNTRDTPEDPVTPVEPDKPIKPNRPVRPVPPGKPHEPVNVMVPDNPMIPYDPSNPGGTLPQTGMLWWPVPVMAFCGTALFMVGWFMRRQRNGARDES